MDDLNAVERAVADAFASRPDRKNMVRGGLSQADVRHIANAAQLAER